MDSSLFQFLLFFALAIGSLLATPLVTVSQNGTHFQLHQRFNLSQNVKIPLKKGQGQITINSNWNWCNHISIGGAGRGCQGQGDGSTGGSTNGTVTGSTARPTTTTTTPKPSSTSTTRRPDAPDFPPTVFPPPEKVNTTTEAGRRRMTIVEMVIEAWDSYVRYAWGSKWLRPISQSGADPKNGRTIISALPVLYIMGLKERYQKAKDYVISEELEVNTKNEQLIYDIYSSLLSTYAMTGERVFLKKATAFAQLYKSPAANSTANQLYKVWRSRRLEYRYLSDLTGERKYENDMSSVEGRLDVLNMTELAENTYNAYYLIKSKLFLQNPQSPEIQQKESLVKKLDQLCSSSRLKKSTKYPLAYSIVRNQPENQTSVEGCQLGSTLHLASRLLDPSNTLYGQFKSLGGKIGQLCHLAANSTQTGLPGEVFSVDLEAPSLQEVIGLVERDFILTDNELAELYFVLWRSTKDPQIREWAWQLAQGLDKYSRTGNGLNNVDDVTGSGGKVISDVQYPQLFTGTLKYLYLIFSDDLLPEEKWVFSYDGHPLPVCGRNAAYSNCAGAKPTLS